MRGRVTFRWGFWWWHIGTPGWVEQFSVVPFDTLAEAADACRARMVA